MTETTCIKQVSISFCIIDDNLDVSEILNCF